MASVHDLLVRIYVTVTYDERSIAPMYYRRTERMLSDRSQHTLKIFHYSYFAGPTTYLGTGVRN